MNNISDRLKRERERLGYSQVAFGELGGVKKLAQLNYEKGDRVPDAKYLEAIGRHGVDIGYVITGKQQSKARQKYFEDRLVNTLKIEPNGGPLTDGLLATIDQLEVVYLQREQELHDIELLLLNMSNADFSLAKEMIVKIYKASLIK